MGGTVERYCLYGFQCLEEAQRSDDPRVKERMLARAELWKELARATLQCSGVPIEQIERWITGREKKLAEIETVVATIMGMNLDPELCVGSGAHFDQDSYFPDPADTLTEPLSETLREASRL